MKTFVFNVPDVPTADELEALADGFSELKAHLEAVALMALVAVLLGDDTDE